MSSYYHRLFDKNLTAVMDVHSGTKTASESVLSTAKNPRCVNLDWLEIYCFEPIERPLNADYYREKGYQVEEREYGTRMYNEMFTIYGTDEWPLLEVRRNPKSSKEHKGIHDVNGCHIRLVNRTCYYNDAAAQLSQFIQTHGYVFSRISRVDVCLDFERFDTGDDPQKFIRRYIKGSYSKINQGRLTAHGEDRWEHRDFNSLSWGNPDSQVGTKLYNKTKELAEVHDKPYIRQAWFLCGLVDDPRTMIKRKADGTTYTPVIWRLEFSVRSSVKNWFRIELDGDMKRKQSYRNTLDMWAGRERLLGMFSSLAQHYFHFKKYKEGVRKDRCDDKVLFNWRPDEPIYKVEHPASQLSRDHQLERFLGKVKHYRDTHIDKDQRAAADTIIAQLERELLAHDVMHPWDKAAVFALQRAIAVRLAGAGIDPATIVNDLKEYFTEHTNELF